MNHATAEIVIRLRINAEVIGAEVTSLNGEAANEGVDIDDLLIVETSKAQEVIESLPDDVTSEETELITLLASISSRDGKTYPIDANEDLKMIRRLNQQFPEANVKEAIMGWQAWLMDHDIAQNANWRLRLRTFVKNQAKFDPPEPVPSDHTAHDAVDYNAIADLPSDE